MATRTTTRLATRMRTLALPANMALVVSLGIFGCSETPDDAREESPSTSSALANGPDLIVTSIRAAIDPATTGQAVRLKATIKNIGNGATPNVTHGVLFLVDGHSEWTTFSGNFFGPLAPGAEQEVVASGGVATAPDGSWTPTAAGDYAITAIVDDAGRITESNEGNNSKASTLTVTGTSPSYSPYAVTNGLAVDSESEPARWLRTHGSHADAAAIRTNIVERPLARWVGPRPITSWVRDFVTPAASASKLPILVGYAIPHRDCGGHSSGGEPDTASYLAWAKEFAQAIGDNPAIVILEPDATMICWNTDKVTQLRGAIDRFTQYAPKTWVYLDAGDSRWNPPSVLAPRIQDVGFAGLRGVSLNVSNYNTEATVRTFMTDFNTRVGRAVPFVFDTSRNGVGSNGDWCNPPGRKLGVPPSVGGTDGLDARFWVKHPGTSDGECGAYPKIRSGQFDAKIAMDLIHGP